jgi:hypothetical protein
MAAASWSPTTLAADEGKDPGFPLWNRAAGITDAQRVPTYQLTHQHAPEECRVAFAAWRGFDSPLRRRRTLASCADGGHQIWWTVEADDPAAALAQLPPYVAERTQLAAVSEVPIP